MITIRSLHFPRSHRPLASVLLSSVILTSVILTSVLLVSGCSILPEPKPDPTRNYVLTAPAESAPVASTQTQNKLSLGLRIVEMPAYLRAQKSIAVRRGANEIVYHDFDRWAETLEDGITRVVCERLTSAPAVSGIAILPTRNPRDCDISIRILQCEGATDATGASPSARFVAQYEITAKDAPVIVRRFEAAPAAWDGKNFSQLATLLGQSAAALADDIAKNLPAK